MQSMFSQVTLCQSLCWFREFSEQDGHGLGSHGTHSEGVGKTNRLEPTPVDDECRGDECREVEPRAMSTSGQGPHPVEG